MVNPSSTQPDTPPASQAPSPRQVVLGLFILGQLAFLVLSNLIGLYQDAQARLGTDVNAAIDRVIPGYAAQTGHAWKIPDEVSTPLRRWAQLTGQDQQWSLFAPGVAKATGFPAVILRWDDDPASAAALARPLSLLNARGSLQAAAIANLLGVRHDELQPRAAQVAAPVLAILAATGPLDLAIRRAVIREPWRMPVNLRPDILLSDNEPATPRRFLRVGLFRFRRYESNLILYETQDSDETDAVARERWAAAIARLVDDNAGQLQAYLRWRLSIYRERHPERPPPRQVILVERVYRILPPDDDSGTFWSGPQILPLVRWQPQVAWESRYQPLEKYNPVKQRFESVLK